MRTLRKRWDKNSVFIVVLSTLIFFLNGLYYGYQKAVVLLLICGFFLFKLRNKEGIRLPKDGIVFSLLTLIIISISGFFYYVEKGMNIYMVFTLIFYLVSYIFIANLDEKSKDLAKASMVFWAVFTVLFISVCRCANFMKDLGYIVGDDLAGPFQYSNSYALFLLIGMHLNLQKREGYGDSLPFINALSNQNKRVLRLMSSFMLFLGIYFTYSKLAIVLTLVYLLYVIFSMAKNKKRAWMLLIAGGIVLSLVVYFEFFAGGLAGLKELLYSHKFSSLKTRFLYYKDAIKMIKTHLFGYGYMGYYFAQHSFQTSYDYSVRYVHNIFLQVFLDLGFFGFIAFLALFFSMLKKTVNSDVFIYIIIFTYSILDFHMQYPIFILLIFLMLEMKFKENVIEIGRNFAIILLCAIMFASYVLLFDYAFYSKDYKLSRDIYPEHTMAYVRDLNSLSIDELEEMSEKNIYISPVYKEVAKRYLMLGEIEKGLDAAGLYNKYNELGDFKEGFYIGILLDAYSVGLPERHDRYRRSYVDRVYILRRRKGTDMNIKHEFDFEIDKDILNRLREIDDK